MIVRNAVVFLFSLVIGFSAIGQIPILQTQEEEKKDNSPYLQVESYNPERHPHKLGQLVGTRIIIAIHPSQFNEYSYTSAFSRKEKVTIGKGRKAQTVEQYVIIKDKTQIVNKYYTVEYVEVLERRAVGKYRLKLIEDSTKNVIYFTQSGENISDFTSPFIPVLRFTFIDQLTKNQKFIFRSSGSAPFEIMRDAKSKKLYNINSGDIVKCKGVVLAEYKALPDAKRMGLRLLMETKDGNQFLSRIPGVKYLKGDSEYQIGFFSVQDLIGGPKLIHPNASKLFSGEEWKLIINKEVEVGMSTKALKMSLGEPKKINTTSSGLDQYVYENAYVFVQSGKVKSWTKH